MKQQSQIDDMRAAVRGDIERAKQRRTPSPVVQVEPKPEPEPAPPPEPERMFEEPQAKSGLFTFFRKR